MGLDQYAGTMREKVYKYTTPQGDKKEEKYQMAGPFEWRKHARLQEFMNTLYMEKNKLESKWEQSKMHDGEDADVVWNPISWDRIELLEDDIDKLETMDIADIFVMVDSSGVTSSKKKQQKTTRIKT